MFSKFKEWYEKRHDCAKAWKEKHGGKVIGGICTDVPEEVIYAGGCLPERRHENLSKPCIR